MLTKPILKTSSAFIFCPVNIICFAIEMPIILANFRVAPNPGVISRLTSGCPKIAFSEHILISQLIDISHPPPRAKPLIAAITGIGKFSILLVPNKIFH